MVYDLETETIGLDKMGTVVFFVTLSVVAILVGLYLNAAVTVAGG